MYMYINMCPAGKPTLLEGAPFAEMPTLCVASDSWQLPPQVTRESPQPFHNIVECGTEEVLHVQALVGLGSCWAES